MALGESSNRRGSAPPRAGLAASLVPHAVAIAAVLSHPPTRSAIATAMPIMVSLISSAPAIEPKTPPRPLPDRQKIERTQPKPTQALAFVAATTAAPAQFDAPTPSIRDLPPNRSGATPRGFSGGGRSSSGAAALRRRLPAESAARLSAAGPPHGRTGPGTSARAGRRGWAGAADGVPSLFEESPLPRLPAALFTYH